MDAVAGQLIGGRYRLARLLGSGGFGRVWSAEDTVLGVRVAVKELRLGHVPAEERRELLVRAAREARHAARLRDHSHIVTVYDVLEIDGAAWIVMQLVEGQSLAERLKADGTLPESRVLPIARALLDALRFVHDAGITHRDVKPANIMLTPGGEILLTDFGIAVDRSDSRLTGTGLVVGTPGYTAPERWLGAEPSGAADLYSLGVTLYAAVEGRLPFPAAEPLAALNAPPPPAPHAGRLAPLLTRLLDGDPAHRPTHAEALALLGDRPRTPPTGPDRGTHGESRRAPNREPDREPNSGPNRGPDRAPDRTPDRVTVKLDSSSDIVFQAAKQHAQEGVVLGLMLAAASWIFQVGPTLFPDPDPTRSHILAAVVAFALPVILKSAWAPLRWGSATSDVITVDHEGLTVTRDSGKRTFTVAWSAVDRIALGVLSPSGSLGKKGIRVWFREGAEPTRDWLIKHRVPKQWPDGSFMLYKDADPAHVPVERLHTPLRTYAGPRYQDTTNPPNPH
ncbi:serine/threonine-protein kinase (plasmid) [Streptomyces sp. BI20]|uniref:serine/threonine-protein kinase n=1 Tax=Streptomyces sp. BI20 TaxID=3403460 RepID=UPI003C78D2DA